MSQSRSKHSEWSCPVCDRTFRLPPDGQRPAMCRECTADCDAAADSEESVSLAKSGPLEDIPVTQRPRRKSAKRRTATRPEAPFQPRTESPQSTSGNLGEREDQEQVLEYLANISRSMTFFRRLVWGMVIMMMLNVLLMGAGAFYAIQQLKSLNTGVELPGNIPLPAGDHAGNAGGDAAAAPLGQMLEQIGEAARTRDELIDEALGR